MKLIWIFMISTVFISGSISLVNAQEFSDLGIKVETIAENLQVPWAIVFSPDDRIFFTERGGDLRVIEDGHLNPIPVTVLDVGTGEGGLLGIALDPNFEENHYMYLYSTYNEFLSTYNRVVRYTESENELTNETILIENIPGASYHDGGRIKFGPDGKLYITTGDAGNAISAQDLKSLSGKILRINSDGTIPDDNPFENSPIYSYGHRNPQGLDWHPETGILVISEHGNIAHDEVNVISAGKNYGWPEVTGDETGPDFVNPILHTGSATWAPSGASFYDSHNIPEWYGKYFVATLRGNHLRMLDLDLENNQVISSESLFFGDFGRLRDVSMGLDGNFYLLTSNQDGRGVPTSNDDRILKIVSISLKDEINGDSSLPPLKQIAQGIAPEEVICKEGLKLIIKNNSSSACVRLETGVSLEQRGWGVMPRG